MSIDFVATDHYAKIAVMDCILVVIRFWRDIGGYLNKRSQSKLFGYMEEISQSITVLYTEPKRKDYNCHSDRWGFLDDLSYDIDHSNWKIRTRELPTMEC